MSIFKKFQQDTKGATAVEYALLATFLSLAIVAGITSIGTKLSSQYINTVGAQLK